MKIVREHLQISQEKLAVMLGVSFATVNRWENEKSVPTYQALEKFNSICKTNKIVFKD